MTQGRFEGKVAIVTGAASGIGRASAIGFARDGAKIVVADIDTAGGAETVQLIREAGGMACFAETDVANSASVQAMVNTAISEYGRLNFAHNNAGIVGAGAPICELPEEVWERGIGVMLTGVFLCMKYEIPHIVAQGPGGPS